MDVASVQSTISGKPSKGGCSCGMEGATFNALYTKYTQDAFACLWRIHTIGFIMNYLGTVTACSDHIITLYYLLYISLIHCNFPHSSNMHTHHVQSKCLKCLQLLKCVL